MPTAPAVGNGCIIVTSPDPALPGAVVYVNVFDWNYGSLALVGFGADANSGVIYGGVYNHTTGMMKFPTTGRFRVQATAQDASGNLFSCDTVQFIQTW